MPLPWKAVYRTWLSFAQAVSPSRTQLSMGQREFVLTSGTAVFTYLTGRVIGKIGYYQILFSVGSAFTSIGAGLLYTLDIGSTVAQSIGFQLLIGFGIGVAINAPIITCQAFSRMDDMPVVTAIVLCKLKLYLLVVFLQLHSSQDRKRTEWTMANLSPCPLVQFSNSSVARFRCLLLKTFSRIRY